MVPPPPSSNASGRRSPTPKDPMNHTPLVILKSALVKAAFAGLLASAELATTGCEVYATGPEYPVYYPSDAYIATAVPVYYEGRATYFYGNHWYYRNGGRWAVYGAEPAYLAARRGRRVRRRRPLLRPRPWRRAASLSPVRPGRVNGSNR